jgi:hypothetical protein
MYEIPHKRETRLGTWRIRGSSGGDEERQAKVKQEVLGKN